MENRVSLFILIEYITKESNEGIFFDVEEFARHQRESLYHAPIIWDSWIEYLMEPMIWDIISECIVEL